MQQSTFLLNTHFPNSYSNSSLLNTATFFLHKSIHTTYDCPLDVNWYQLMTNLKKKLKAYIFRRACDRNTQYMSCNGRVWYALCLVEVNKNQQILQCKSLSSYQIRMPHAWKLPVGQCLSCHMNGIKQSVNFWVILGLRPTNERYCYFVTTSLIGWLQA